MLEDIYKDKKTISRLREGPINKQVEALEAYYTKKHYPKKHVKKLMGEIGCFNRWLVENNIFLPELDEIKIASYINSRQQHTKSFVTSGSRSALYHLIEMLRESGDIPKKNTTTETKHEEIKKALDSYNHYLIQDRGFSQSSLTRYLREIKRFLIHIPVSFHRDHNQLTADNLLDYITDFGKQHSSKNTQCLVSILRSYLCYAFSQGKINQDLSQFLPTSFSVRSSHLPEFLSATQCRKLLSSCHRDTAVGNRNYAILLILMRLGLRASELINLTLDEINWESGEIIIHGKGNKTATLPLPQDVGDAIVSYLESSRPVCNSRHLFVGSRAPFNKFNHPSCISSIVSRSLAQAKIMTQLKGAHLLRYTTAHDCIDHGASLFEVAGLLRHSNIDMAAKYIKIDFSRLKNIAQPWPQPLGGINK